MYQSFCKLNLILFYGTVRPVFVIYLFIFHPNALPFRAVIFIYLPACSLSSAKRSSIKGTTIVHYQNKKHS